MGLARIRFGRGSNPDLSRVTGSPPPKFAAGLAYETAGSGEPLLLVHGVASSRGAFNPVIESLAQHYQVIAVDLPGHGDSPVSARPGPLTPGMQALALASLLDDLGIARAHLVGNSMGGWVSLELAADQRATSVTGLCPAGLWQPHTTRSRVLDFNHSVSVLAGPVTPIAMRVAPLREYLFRGAVERRYRVDHAIARTAVDGQRAAAGFDAAHLGLLDAWFTRAEEIPTDVPVTVIFGDNDQMLPADTSQIRELAPPHADWLVQPRMGHAPMWDDPEGTVAAIRRTTARAAK